MNTPAAHRSPVFGAPALAAGLLLAAGGVGSQMAWPTSAILQPTMSLSPAAAPIATDAAPLPSAAGGSPWAGAWRGWACRSQACDVALVVEEVAGSKVRLVYAVAGSGMDSHSERVEGELHGTELHATLQSGTRIAFRPRADGHLDFAARLHGGSRWIAGVLTQETVPLGGRRRAAEELLARETIDLVYDISHLPRFSAMAPQKWTIKVRPAAGRTEFLGVNDLCLRSGLPSIVKFVDPYLVIDFGRMLPDCRVFQYRIDPVSGQGAHLVRQPDDTWQNVTAPARLYLAR